MSSPGCPLQSSLLGVTPLPWDLSPENRCQTWDPRAKFHILIVQNAECEGPPFEPSNSAKLAGNASVLPMVSPLTPTRCNPVALSFKPRESVSNLGPPGRISCFISNRNQSSEVRRSSPRPRTNCLEVPVSSSGCPLLHLLDVTPLAWT